MTFNSQELLDKNIENFKYANNLIKIIALVIGIIIFLSSKNAFIFFTAAMLPSIVAVFVDRVEHKCASATICSFNLIGMMPYINQFWKNKESINYIATNLIIDPMTWLSIYSAVFVGFLLYLSLPAIISNLYFARANIKMQKIHEQISNICLDWGIRLEEIEDLEDR